MATVKTTTAAQASVAKKAPSVRKSVELTLEAHGHSKYSHHVVLDFQSLISQGLRVIEDNGRLIIVNEPKEAGLHMEPFHEIEEMLGFNEMETGELIDTAMRLSIMQRIRVAVAVSGK